MSPEQLLPNNKLDLLVTIVIFILAFSLFSLGWDYSLGENSGMHLLDGVSTVGAERVLNGEMPYRDFWTMYAPGHFYALAVIFSIFGSGLMVEVMAASVVSAAGVSACYWAARGLTENRWLAAGSAAVFLAAMYNTGYYQRLGSYPTGIFFIFLTFFFIFLFFKTNSPRILFCAGLASGALVLFKHDVGIYTGIAITGGLAANYFGSKNFNHVSEQAVWRNVLFYLAGAALMVMPALLYFVFAAWKDMLQSLVIFPLTDFRYARPEGYPSLLPGHILAVSGFDLALYLARYVNFTLPFLLFLLGLIGTTAALRKRNVFYFSSGVMLTLAFVLHYYAAHIQINTHIVSMSVYASWIGIMQYELFLPNLKMGKGFLTKALAPVLVLGWFTALILQPGFDLWKDYQGGRVEVDLGKFSGFRLNKRQSEKLGILKEYLDANLPADQEIYVGNNRHDVIIIGDTMVQFLLDRPIATRYQELHPGISDTAKVQQEMINDLQEKEVQVLVLKRIFADSTLEKAKADFRKNIPQIGAQDLDNYIRENYLEIKQIGPYTVWILKGS